VSRIYEEHRSGNYERRGMISIDELKELANGNVRSLASHLLPNGRENCGFWEVGSIAGEKGQSLKVNLTGNNRGLWTDFSAAKGSPGYSGNLIQLTAHVMFGGDVGDAIRYLKSWLGIDDMDPERLAKVKARAVQQARDHAKEAAKEREKKRARAHQLFLSGVPIPGTPAEAYLCERGIDLRGAGMAAPGSLRFHPEVWCAEVHRKLPAMLAAIVGLDGRHLGTHRTYLRADGRDKAQLGEAKKALGNFKSGFIPLWKGAQRCSMKDLKPGTRIYASEGIEDGLSVALVRRPERIIAAVSLSNIGNLDLADRCPLYILGQRDEKLQAIEALEAAVARHQEAGREVFLVTPPEGFKDYNAPIDRRGKGRVRDGK